MPRRRPEPTQPPDLSVPAGRIEWLLGHAFSNNLRRMADEVGIAHSAIHNIIKRAREPGRRVMAAIAAHPRVNPSWLLDGAGEPLVVPRNELPIADSILPGLPSAHNGLLIGQTLAVTEGHYRATRYVYRIPSAEPIVGLPAEKVAAGDLLIMEADAGAWLTNLLALADRLCGVRVPGIGGHVCVLARARLDRRTHDLRFDTFGVPGGEGRSQARTEGIGAERRPESILGRAPRKGIFQPEPDEDDPKTDEFQDQPMATPPAHAGSEPAQSRATQPSFPTRKPTREPKGRGETVKSLAITDVVAMAVLLMRL